MPTARMQALASVDEYIAAQPTDRQARLKQLRTIVQKTAPKAEEGISYGMPAYKLHGPLIYFAAFKNHDSVFAMPAAVEAFKDRLVDYVTSKGTVQLPLDKPLPVKLITDMVKFRLQRNEEKAALKQAVKKTKARP